MRMKRERIRYTAEQKQVVVARMMPPQNEAVAKMSCTGCTNNSDNSLQFMKIHGVS